MPEFRGKKAVVSKGMVDVLLVEACGQDSILRPSVVKICKGIHVEDSPLHSFRRNSDEEELEGICWYRNALYSTPFLFLDIFSNQSF